MNKNQKIDFTANDIYIHEQQNDVMIYDFYHYDEGDISKIIPTKGQLDDSKI